MASPLPLGDFQIGAVKSPDREIAALRKTGFKPRADQPAVPFALPFDWAANPLNDRNWMFQLHAWRMLDPHLAALRTNRAFDTRRAEALAILRDWFEASQRHRDRDYFWYDMAVGIRASKLAFLSYISAFRGRPTIADSLPEWPEIVQRHFDSLLDPKELNPGNHGIFQMLGLATLAWAMPDHALATKARAYAFDRLQAIVRGQLGPDGIHTEDSPGYHFFVLKHIPTALGTPFCREAMTDDLRELVAKGNRACPWLLDSADRILDVGDSNPQRVDPAKLRPLRRWPHLAQNGYLGAIVGGYGIIRSRADTDKARRSLLFLMGSHYAQAHKHSDCLSVLWQERGEKLLIDSGKYGYQRDRMRDYFLSTRAHNTVEIDEICYSRRLADAYGAAPFQLAPLGAAWWLAAEVRHRPHNRLHRRGALFHPGRFLCVVDSIAAPGGVRRYLPAAVFGPHRFTAWWHFAPAFTVTLAGDHVLARHTQIDDLRLTIRHLSNLPHSTRHHCGEMEPRPQGWHSPSYRRYDPAPCIGFAARGTGPYRAATLFVLQQDDSPPPSLTASGDGGFVLSDAASDRRYVIDPALALPAS